MPHRQEVLNVVLADLLIRREVVAGPENIVTRDGVRQMPDVIVQYQGLRLAIEGEIEAPDAREKAQRSATRRVESGIAHMGMGVIYPQALRDTDFSLLREEMANSRLDILVVSEADVGGYESGNIDYLENLLRRVFERLLREDVVAEAVAMIDVAVDDFAKMTMASSGVSGRILKALERAKNDRELARLTNAEKTAGCRVGGLVLLNAMIFGEVLSVRHVEVPPLGQVLSRNAWRELTEGWQYVLDEINFHSIFWLASEIMDGLSFAAPDSEQVLQRMANVAQQICLKRAALNHDLMGRVYHRLLADAKYLGTYYTSLAAATLLLKLALRPQGWQTDWASPDEVGKMNIADLACGTGTLLVAAADAALDNHVSAAAAERKPVLPGAMHQSLIEKVLHGYDVLESAIHISASNLALRSPGVTFDKMKLFVMEYGGRGNHLGTLDFLGNKTAQVRLDMGGAIEQEKGIVQVTGKGGKRQRTELPMLDLCVMNPPFVRSVGGNLLFGSMTATRRARMQERLKQLVPNTSASITSGLGAVFVALANRHVRDGGRLALVLPKALLSGVSWKKVRDLVNTFFRIDFLIVSHDAERWNFSESTSLSEVLLVATREPCLSENHKTTIVNLWHNPATAIEALPLANQIQRGKPPDLSASQGVATLTIGGEKAAEMISVDCGTLKADWFLPCSFAQADLTRIVLRLRKGEVWLPTLTKSAEVSLCSLETLGTLGPDARDIHDGFLAVDSPTTFASFWGHKANAVNRMAQEPNRWLQPLEKAKKGRKLRLASDLWQHSGNLLIAERLRLNTCRLSAVCLGRDVLSNVWWPTALYDDFSQTGANKILALWLNSSLGLISLLSVRTETEGAWVKFKKPLLKAMPVLDIRKLDDAQLAQLAAAYDDLCEQELQPLPRMAEDETRAAIDNALSEVLGLPDLAPLREMLAREPVVSMQRL
ncbi:MAG: hypothetical protein OXF32_06680 [Anaerolineaceae bacterium]|nr:hypothetical protein [Anaerolineaceae bacterium]